MSITEQVRQLKTDFDEVYEAGYTKGKAEAGDTDAAYQQGITDGKKAEYDRHWDAFQQNGNRTEYNYAFASYSTNDIIFYPKYDIKPKGSVAWMFAAWSGYLSLNRPKFDLVARLEECGVVLDTSQATDFTNMFYYGYSFTRIPTIDMRKATNTTRAFSYLGANAVTFEELTIDKVMVSESTPYNQTFQNAYRLKHITFEGVIGQTGLNFNWSPLTVASMKSIISCLKNLTGTAGEGVYTIQFSSACWDALEADEERPPSGDTWQDYVSTVLGWSI